MLAVIVTMSLMFPGVAQAADMYGLIAGTTTNWNTTASNWSTTFGGSYNTTWVQGSGAILTNGTTGAIGAFTVGAPITLTKLILGSGIGSVNISQSGGGSLTFSGALSYLIDNSQANAGNPLFYVPIYADTGLLHFRQKGWTVLQVSNNFAGAVHIDSGRLSIENANALTGTSGVIVSNNAVLGINVNVSNVSVTLNGTGTGNSGGSALEGGNSSGGLWAGNVVLNTDSSIGDRGGTSADPFVVSGTISENGGPRSLIINSAGNDTAGAYGSGYVKLSGTNTYSGSTTVRSGTLLLGTNAPSGAVGALGNATSDVVMGDVPIVTQYKTIVLLTDGTFTVDRNITVANYGTTTTIGGNQSSGTSTFTGTNTLNKAVTLQAKANSEVDFTTGKITGVGGVTTTGGGTILLSGPNDYSGGTVATNITLLTDNASALGSGIVNLLAKSTLKLQQALTISSNLLGTAGAYVNLNGNTLTINQGGASSFAGAITNSGGLVKGGAGQLTLSGTNSYSGTTVIQAGTLRLGTNNAIPRASALMLTEGSTLDMNGFLSTAQSLAGSGRLMISTNSTLALTGALTANLEVVFDPSGFDPYKKYDIVTCTGTPSGTYTCSTKPWILIASDGKLTLCQIRGTMVRFM